MTTEAQHCSALMPFLLRFSEPLPPQEAVRMQYDSSRQLSLVEIDGQWIDATVSQVGGGGTRITKIQAETTDDN